MKRYLMKLMAALFVVAGVISGPLLTSAQAAEQKAAYAPIDLRNTTYTIEAVMSGEDGVGQIKTPTSIFVREKQATIVITWDTPDYNYMIVGGEKILPKSKEGGAVFWIPVTAWDEEIALTVNKGFQDAEDLSCSLFLNTETIKRQGNYTVLYILIVLNMILAVLNAINMVKKRKLFAERVETKDEAAKFAKQQAKKKAQPAAPQRRLVLDENGNFVTEDVFESAKNYKSENTGAGQNPPTPPQDAPAPQLWWRRTGEETLIIDIKDDGYRVKEIRPMKTEESEETAKEDTAETK